MEICENCGKDNNGNFGSGRFCSEKCARGFSTKANRNLINDKIRITFSQKIKNKPILKICKTCGVIFESEFKRRKRKNYCSIKCRNNNPDSKLKISEARIRSIEKGIINGAGIKMNFIFNDKIIKCESILEYSCLLFFCNKYNVKNIERNRFKIPYIIENQKKIYIPDFIIETENKFIVECKSSKLSSDLREKWRKYISDQEIKRKILKEFALKNNMIDFWYTETTASSFYKEAKFLRSV